MTTAIYAVLILVNVIGGVRNINRSIFGSDDLRIFVTLPVSSSAMYIAKMAVAYLKQFIFGFFTVLPVSVTLATYIDLGAQFYGMTVLILFFMPLISLAVGSVLALPVHMLTEAVGVALRHLPHRRDGSHGSGVLALFRRAGLHRQPHLDGGRALLLRRGRPCAR